MVFCGNGGTSGGEFAEKCHILTRIVGRIKNRPSFGTLRGLYVAGVARNGQREVDGTAATTEGLIGPSDLWPVASNGPP